MPNNKWIEEKMKEFDKRWTFANFCWNDSNYNGKYFANLEKRRVKMFIRTALQEAEEGVIKKILDEHEKYKSSVDKEYWVTFGESYWLSILNRYMK